MFGLDSVWHWLLLLVIVLVVFGTKKIGNIGPDLGNAVRGFKKALKGGDDEDDKAKAAAQAKEQLRAEPPASTSTQNQHDSHESK